MLEEKILGLKDVIIHEIKEYLDCVAIHVSLAKKEQVCPSCGVKTIKVHDYRIQKVKHLKWFERLTILSVVSMCLCLWKAIFASLAFVDRYQRFSKEWNQVARIRSVKAKTFKEAADVLGILNSYVFGYSNGFLEGINNTSKVIKRNAYGFRKHDHFKAKILLSRVYI